MITQSIAYRDGVMVIGDTESLLQQYRAIALRVDEVGTLELLILAEEEPVLVWQDIQEIEQLKTQ